MKNQLYVEYQLGKCKVTIQELDNIFIITVGDEVTSYGKKDHKAYILERRINGGEK